METKRFVVENTDNYEFSFLALLDEGWLSKEDEQNVKLLGVNERCYIKDGMAVKRTK